MACEPCAGDQHILDRGGHEEVVVRCVNCRSPFCEAIRSADPRTEVRGGGLQAIAIKAQAGLRPQIPCPLNGILDVNASLAAGFLTVEHDGATIGSSQMGMRQSLGVGKRHITLSVEEETLFGPQPDEV